jgi:hypothetical protein
MADSSRLIPAVEVIAVDVCTKTVYTIFVHIDAEHTFMNKFFRGWLKKIVGRWRARRYRALMDKLRYADG